MKLFKHITSAALISMIAIASTAWAEPQTVKIGLIYPLTGPMSSFGEDMAKALPLLEKKFNSEQSKYKFSLLIEDGKFGQTNTAITAAHKLVDVDGVKFLVIGSSGEALQVAPFAESSHILTVTGFSSHPDIKKAGDYIFRTYFDVGPGIQTVADELKEKGISRVAVLTEESSFTSAARDSLQKGLGDRIIFNDSYAVGDADLKALVARARGKHPEAYYLNITAPDSFITLVNQLRNAGVTEPFYTFYVPSRKEVQDSLGAKLNGIRYLDFPDTPDVSNDFKKFLEQFEKEKGNAIKGPFNFKTNYNAVKVIYDAVVAVGPDPSAAKDFLYRYDKPSATGNLKFDANGDAIGLNLVLKTYMNPK